MSLLCCVFDVGSATIRCQHGANVYSRADLLNIAQLLSSLPVSTVIYDLPDEVKKCPRRRGKRAGARIKARRRCYRPFMPSVTFGNIRSIANKADNLRVNCRYLHEFREACIIGLVETWLTENMPDSAFEVPGFIQARGDRTALSGKTRGGGLALLLNERWCNNITIKEKLCTKDIELLSITTRPFYLPREFTNVYVTAFYIPPDANQRTATESVLDLVTRLSNAKPDALHLILGDANQCVNELSRILPTFEQCVTCPTRQNTILDPFFCNVKNAYRSRILPPLSNSDHNMINMMPVYKSKLKQVKPKVITKISMDENAEQMLNACFELTDWELFITDSAGDVNALTDVVTSYITFCHDLHAVKNEVRIFPNNKPWVTSELRQTVVMTHKSHGTPEYSENHRKLQKDIRGAKQTYKSKVESLFTSNESRDAWRGLKTLTGMEKIRRDPAIITEPGSADRLNAFYSRFDDSDLTQVHSEVCNRLRNSVRNDDFELDIELVKKSLKKIKIRKAAGPDGIGGKIIKCCQDSLLYILHHLFQLSFRMCVYPDLWKIGEIVPIEKKPLPQQDNDLRPVTLTDVLSKCLERVGLWMMWPFVELSVDPLQFAYIAGRSTTDAITTMLHRITRHLDRRAGNTARILFLDYSSAFNTIRPHLLVDKLSKLDVPESLQLWIFDYLTNRCQYVRTSHERSGKRTINTGAPQGCVLSPVLFVLYTNDLAWDTPNVFISKYADDTAIAGLFTSEDNSEYLNCISFVNNWCADNFLKLNVSKTKELVLDFRKSRVGYDPVVINDMVVDTCDSYKYLGIHFDCKLKFVDQVDNVYKKSLKKLYYIRTMYQLNVDKTIINLFFNAVVIPAMVYCIVCYYEFLTCDLKNRLDKPGKICKKIARLRGRDDNIVCINERFRSEVIRVAKCISRDPTHPLNVCFELMPSGRRWRMPVIRTSRFRNSFIPTAVRLLNM